MAVWVVVKRLKIPRNRRLPKSLCMYGAVWQVRDEPCPIHLHYAIAGGGKEQVGCENKEMRRMIGVILFDTITTFKEFDEIVRALTKLGFNLEVSHRPDESDLEDWQLIITKNG